MLSQKMEMDGVDESKGDVFERQPRCGCVLQ